MTLYSSPSSAGSIKLAPSPEATHYQRLNYNPASQGDPTHGSDSMGPVRSSGREVRALRRRISDHPLSSHSEPDVRHGVAQTPGGAGRRTLYRYP
jgi:hypothetical protein